MPLINCETNLNLILSENCVIVYADVANQDATFAITETKLYVRVVTLSTQDNSKLLQQLKSGFKRIVNRDKYQWKPELLVQNANFNYLVEPGFQGENRLFVLAFEDDTQRPSNKRYYHSNVEINDYNVMTDGKSFVIQPIKNNKVTNKNRKIPTGQGDDYTTGCLLDYAYLEDNYKMIAIDLSKQKALDTDPRAIQ